METKTIIETATGKEICATSSNECLPTETLVSEIRTFWCLKPYFNFNTREYYEEATQEELDDYNKVECPPEVALWKVRVILKVMQLEDVVANALENLEEPTKTAALYIWSYGTAIDRDSQTIAFLQTVLQLTNDQVDQIFIQANALKL
jgi:hypothetical protein